MDLKKLFFIDDIPTFLTIKEMVQKFELIDYEDIDLNIEEEKLKTRELFIKLLSFERTSNGGNILLSNKEIEELNNLLDKHHNRILFLQNLSTYRTKGEHEFPLDLYELIYKLFCTILNTIERDKDFHSAKNIIILSQTYYYLVNGKKIYLQEKIKKHKLFNNYKFWKDYLEFSIEKEIINSIKTEKENGTLIKNKKESEVMYANMVFAQLVPISDNMIDFGLDRKKIKEIIKPIIKHYNMDEQSINIIDDVLHRNSQRNSILLNEEIKQIDVNLLYKNYKNFDSDKKLDTIFNLTDTITYENNDVDAFKLDDIYENIDDDKNMEEDRNNDKAN